MADIKITDLPPTAQAELTDLFEKVTTPSTLPTSEGITLQQIFDLIGQAHQSDGDPVAPPTLQSITHTYYNRTTKDTWTWNTDTLQWE